MTGGGPIIRGTVAVAFAIVLLIPMLVMAGAIVDSTINTKKQTDQFAPSVGQGYVIDQSITTVPDDAAVSPTTGNAVRLDGTDDAGITWTSSGSPTTGPWTVCAWTVLDDDANLDATYDIAAIGNGSAQLEYEDGNWLAYYENGTHSAVIRASATTPRNPTTVCGRYDGRSLSLIINGSQQASQALTTATEPRNLSVSLNGRVDEIRVSNSSVSTTRLSTYASTPTVPLDGTSRAARLMLDEGSGDTSTVYFASGSATLTGHTWTEGVSERALTVGADYRQSEDPWTITPFAGGELDGQPVAYVIYLGGGSPFGGQLLRIVGLAESAAVLMAIALLLVPAAATIALMRVVRTESYGKR